MTTVLANEFEGSATTTAWYSMELIFSYILVYIGANQNLVHIVQEKALLVPFYQHSLVSRDEDLPNILEIANSTGSNVNFRIEFEANGQSPFLDVYTEKKEDTN